MFTKKHYEAIARSIKGCDPYKSQEVIYSLCIMFEGDNPNFNKLKFILASTSTPAEYIGKRQSLSQA